MIRNDSYRKGILRDGERLETVARWGAEPPVAAVFALEDCWAMRRGQPHEVVDAQGSLLCRHFARRAETGYLCVPLTVQGETLGVFCLIGVSPGKGERPASQKSLWRASSIERIAKAPRYVSRCSTWIT
jgi:hypothetical protein